MTNLQMIRDSVNFFDLVTFFGEQKIKLSYNNVSMCCPFHEEKTPSFYYNLESKRYKCFSCGVGGDIFDYVMHKHSYKSLPQAVEFLLDFCGLSKDSVKGEYIKRDKSLSDFSAISKYNKKNENNFSECTEGDIKAFVDMRGDFFLDRGFTRETLDFFQVGFDPIKKRVTIPIRDKDSNLVGVTGRTIVKDFKETGVQKWLHYKGSSISNSFFNLNNALPYSKSSDGSIILCEGPSDVMWMWQNGFKNTIGLFCNNITSQKKKILLENFMTIYLFLDGDSGGENGVSSIMEQINGYFNIFKVNCPTGKDPDNFNKQEIQSLLDSATKLC